MFGLFNFFHFLLCALSPFSLYSFASAQTNTASASTASTSTPWALVYLNPMGSGRHLGLGGADTGLSQEISGLSPSPAGLAFLETKFDVSYFVNKSSRISNSTNQSESIDSNTFAGIVVGYEKTIFGFSYCLPFDYSSKYSGSDDVEFRHRIFDFLFAYKVNDFFSAGIIYREDELYQYYRSAQLLTPLQDTNVAYRLAANMVFRNSAGGFGFSFFPEKTISGNEALNNQLSNNLSWFRGAYLPEQQAYGLFFHDGNLTWLIDYKIFKLKQMGLQALSGYQGFSTHYYNPSQLKLLHIGVDWMVADREQKKVYWRMGVYREPLIDSSSEYRDHTTMGLDIQLGVLMFGVAYDWASEYNRTIQGLTIQWRSLKM